MKRPKNPHIFLLILLTGITIACVEQKESIIVPPVEHPEAYVQVTNQRAEKIVKQMDIDDPAKAERVKNIIAQQYRDLSAIQDTRDADIEAVKKENKDEQEAGLQIQAIREEANDRIEALHKLYISRLSAELNSEQIVQVKNGMTYNVVPITYKGYLRLLPELTEEQKQTIMEYLVEAREHAIDAGSSEKKHGWFNEYKGRINNYLSAEGYNLKKAEERLKKRQEAQ